ncbi:MAG: MFS transporter, partial [Chloroflexota bacterium]|nr:MFS transporter [Chloroflexota bacterium]
YEFPGRVAGAVAGVFAPRDALTDEQRQAGLRAMNYQAIAASGADGLISGGFLAAFALLLGASNVHIGILTALPPILQPVQLIAVVLIERLRMRKPFAVMSYFIAYAAWIPVALIPFILEVPHAGAVTLLLVFVALRGIAQAFLNPSWIGWIRDIVPQDVMGSFFSQRMRIATIAAAVAGLVGAFYIDWWAGRVPEPEKIYGYSYAMLFGSILLGFGAVGFMARMPEPRMVAPEGQRPTIAQMLAAPLRDANYRQLMSFLMVWSLASQLAVPFFSVYMLTKLEMPLSAVVGLAVLSQATSVLFVNVWGGYVDRFGSKVVLSISSSLYLLVILGWTFTTTPEAHALTVPLLIVLHFLIGIASAGINLASTTIRMKMAPQAQSTSYLTGASLAASLGAGIGPILGGAFVDFFSVRRFEISIEWVDPARTVEFPAVFLTGYDFLFALAFLFGLATLSVLGRVREEGESNREAVMSELAAQTRENLRVLNSVPGMNLVGSLPLGRRRFVPAVAGLDVAAGVTAYQLAASIQSVATTAARSGATARQLQSRVNRTIARAVEESDNVRQQGAALAFGAVQGAVQAAAETGLGAGRVVHESVSGLLDATAEAVDDPRAVLRGAIQGAIQSGSDAGMSMDSVATDAIEATRAAAPQLGMTERDAVAYAAEVAVEASSELPEDTRTRIRNAALEAIFLTAHDE